LILNEMCITYAKAAMSAFIFSLIVNKLKEVTSDMIRCLSPIQKPPHRLAFFVTAKCKDRRSISNKQNKTDL